MSRHLAILDGEGSHAERLARLIHGHILYMWENRDPWWLSMQEYRELSPDGDVTIEGLAEYYTELVVNGMAGADTQPPSSAGSTKSRSSSSSSARGGTISGRAR